MEEIAKGVFLEKNYAGVIAGIIQLNQGLLMVDAPYQLDDQFTWQQELGNLSSGDGKLIVMLDTHTDRLLGIQSVDFPVVAHEKSLDIILNLPAAQRATEVKPGPEADSYDPHQAIRWILPDMMYSHQMSIYWDEQPVVITHQPGAHIAGSWVHYDARKVVFVGDSVVVNQPPFLGWADLDRWIEALNWLCSNRFRDYKIISGRYGVVQRRSIVKMMDFLSLVESALADLSMMENRDEGILQIAPKLLRKFSFDRELTDHYKNRLIRGLKQLIKRHEADQTER